jgi:exodeoxyribonuclease VIII
VQDAFYIDGLAANDIECKGFIFVAVEKSAPFGVGIYELPAEAIAEGREAYIRNLNTYMECRTTGKWTGYTPQLIQW